MPYLNRKAQVCVVVEGAEGTAATMAAASATMLPYDLAYSDAPEMFERNPARATLTKLPRIVGKQIGTASWRCELKGTGSLATRPSWDAAIRACGFSSAAISTATVSGMTGTFIPGELFTVSSGVCIGRVVGRMNSATSFAHVPTSGAIATGVTITGSTSGAVCVAAANAAGSKGFDYRPYSSGIPSVTVGVYRDGMLFRLAGARGNVSIEGNVGEPAFLNFTFSGVRVAATDTALLTVTHETTEPPAFKSATTYIDSLQAVYSAMSVDMGNVLAQRESAAASAGVLSYYITDRDPRLTIDPEMVLVATKDFHGRLHSASTGWWSTQVGSTSTNRVLLGSPKVQYLGVGHGDRSGLFIANLEYGLVAPDSSSGDRELQIALT